MFRTFRETCKTLCKFGKTKRSTSSYMYMYPPRNCRSVWHVFHHPLVVNMFVDSSNLVNFGHVSMHLGVERTGATHSCVNDTDVRRMSASSWEQSNEDIPVLGRPYVGYSCRRFLQPSWVHDGRPDTTASVPERFRKFER